MQTKERAEDKEGNRNDGSASPTRLLETFEKRPFLPNPPDEDAACGEADKFLRLPREMHSPFLRGQAQILILKILNVFKWLKLSPSPGSRSGIYDLNLNPG